MPHARATVVLGMVLAIAACQPSTPAASQSGTVAPTTVPAAPSTAAAPTAAAALTGAWSGALEDPSGSYPALLSLEGCVDIGKACGEMEYLNLDHPDVVQCASELTLTSRDANRYEFSEAYVFHGWLCFTTTYAMTVGTDGSIAVDQFGEPGVVCCRGTFVPAAASPEATPVLPAAIAALGTVTSITALGGTTTQYPAFGEGASWWPLDDHGSVARVDASTGGVTAVIKTGDPGALDGLKTDPHAVAAGDAGVWVAQASARAVGRIDPATNTVIDSIPLTVVPYALALDGTTLWVTSFEDDRVLRVDLASHKVVADIAVNKPTGIAVGAGAVWAVRHRDDALVRISPKTNKVVADISLGARGPNDTCGMCVENVVFSDGSVWTANNWGRSVSRVDPATNKVAATIALEHRPWTVGAGGGSIWASQFEGTADGVGFDDMPSWGLASIDPATNEATTIGVPGAFSVAWGGDALWVVVPERRQDFLVRIELER